MKAFGLAFLVTLALVPSALAQNGQERGAALSTRLMSPFCPGLTIHDCPTKESEELRAQIIEWAEDGWTNDEIVAELESEYGPNIRAIPSDGNSWLIWAIPGLALAAGIALATVVARRWSRDSTEPAAGTERWATSSSEERARLEGELGEMKRNSWGRT